MRIQQVESGNVHYVLHIRWPVLFERCREELGPVRRGQTWMEGAARRLGIPVDPASPPNIPKM